MKILRETDLAMLHQAGKRYRLATKETGATPKSRRVTESDVEYLLGLSEQSFHMATVLDFGVGVCQG